METLAGHNGGTWCGGVMMVRHWGIMNTKETYKLGMHRLTGQRSEPAGFCL